MTNVSLLGHLCGILSGFACEFPPHFDISLFLMCSPTPKPQNKIFPYSVKKLGGNSIILFILSDTYGLFNFLMPGTSFYSAIEASPWLVSNLFGATFITARL